MVANFGLGVAVDSLGFGVGFFDSGLRVWEGSGFRVRGLGFGVEGLEFYLTQYIHQLVLQGQLTHKNVKLILDE